MTSHWNADLILDATPAPVLPAPAVAIERIIVGQTPAMRGLKRLLCTLGPSDAPVLVRGETGTGKELVAQALHAASGRGGPLVAVNCAAIPADLLEAELFGHEKGAFTGADRQRIGRIEQAAGGTLFLDEIGDMPLALQAKLLRVLESRRVQRLGGATEVAVDFRLVTATHREIEARVATGAFRADLFYRIAVFPVTVPRLAERTADIPALLARMIDDQARATPAAPVPHFDTAALRALAAHTWPGNVRELRNVVIRAFVLFPGRMIGAAQVRENLLSLAYPDEDAEPLPAPEAVMDGAPGLPDPARFGGLLADRPDLDLRSYLRDIEVSLIESALDRRGGSVTHAAETLRLRRTTLIEKMKKYGINRGLAA